MKVTLNRASGDSSGKFVLAAVWLIVAVIQAMIPNWIVAGISLLPSLIFLYDGLWRRSNPMAELDGETLTIYKGFTGATQLPLSKITSIEEDLKFILVKEEENKLHRISRRSSVEDNLEGFVQALKKKVTINN
ncbi:MAG: hypothetical protein MRZ79_16385 [Bacteroidia bacterium]|nr:hypothetical protein [Bacteroidia bacterium]